MSASNEAEALLNEKLGGELSWHRVMLTPGAEGLDPLGPQTGEDEQGQIMSQIGFRGLSHGASSLLADFESGLSLVSQSG